MTDRRPTLLVLLVILSLVFHGCFLIVFLFMERPQNIPPSISFESFDNQNNNQNQFSSGVAALKPRASSFGVPVSLHNEPPPSIQQNNDPQQSDDRIDQPAPDTQDSEGHENDTIKNNDPTIQEASANESDAQLPQSLETPTPDKNSSETKVQSSDANLLPRRKRRKKKSSFICGTSYRSRSWHPNTATYFC